MSIYDSVKLFQQNYFCLLSKLDEISPVNCLASLQSEFWNFERSIGEVLEDIEIYIGFFDY